MRPKEFEYSVEALKCLPGISKKSAENISNFILNQDNKFVKDLTSILIDLKYKVKFCNICNNLTSGNVNCDICNEISRDLSKLCIVSNFNDLIKIDSLGSYDGLYFNLGKEIDSKKKNVNDFDEMIERIEKLVIKNNINSILMATNMTINGEFTAFYISSYLKKTFKNIKIYRLATGLPMNSSIDYIDNESLNFAIKNKIII